MSAEVLEGYRLSPQQRRLWLLQQANAEVASSAPLHWSWLVLHLCGELDADILNKALQSVEARHEILRTVFCCLPGATIPVQVIRDRGLAFDTSEDWSSPNPDWRTRLEELFDQTWTEPFDIEHALPLRIALRRIGRSESLLIVRLPALLADLAGGRILAAEIARAYALELDGRQLPSAEDLQYADLAEWQNETLESEEAAEGKVYWKKLASEAANLELPFAQFPKTTDFQPQVLSCDIEPSLQTALATSARQCDVPYSGLLLAGWQILLWRLTAQPDITLGVCLDGRGYEGLDVALGLLARFLPVRSRLATGLSSAQLVAQNELSLAEAGEYQEYVSPEPGAASLSFGFEFCETDPVPAAGPVEFTVYQELAAVDRFKVQLTCTLQAGKLTVRFVYDPEVLTRNYIQRLAARYQRLLGQLAADPQAAVETLEVLDDHERHEVLVEFNRSEPVSAGTLCVHQLFEQQARRYPQALAVRCEDQELTYGELFYRSDCLARDLQALGVGRETWVGICLERSVDVVVAMFGILAAGGAYVPLDPGHPSQRLEFLARDAGLSAVVTRDPWASVFDGVTAVVAPPTTGLMDHEDPGTPRWHDQSSHDNVAYAIYTSGSTGKPKGVAVEHRQLVNYVQGANERLSLPAGGSYAIVSTFAADLGNTMIFPALCFGGCLHVIAEHRTADPQGLAEYLSRHPVDCLKLVPSHLALLLNSEHPEQVLPQRRLVLGGEACTWALVKRVQSHRPDCRIFNHYGPTEATVGVIAHQLMIAEDLDRLSAPPLGRPLPNSTIYVLDGLGQPLPAGVPGELYIGGAGLARGYVSRARLTAEAFRPDPFSSERGARFYRTGDLGRHLEDGRLEFLGRVDHQVKIRGFRVELGEIESALEAHTAVQTSLVLARPGKNGYPRLVAYVVAQGGQAPRPKELSSFLAERLPETMIPAVFVKLDRLPLTPNGKVDLKALPDPNDKRSDTIGQLIEPKTPTEVQVLHIWEELLDVPAVGVTDDFFELGGDSFLAVRLMARIRSELGRNLPLATVLDARTVERMAMAIDAEELPKQTFLVTIQPRGERPPVYCVHPGHGNIVCYLDLARQLGPEQPVYGLQAPDLDQEGDPYVSIEEMAARYCMAIREQQPEGPYFLAGWSFGGMVAFEIAQQLQRSGQVLASLCLLDCRLPVTAAEMTRIKPELIKASMLLEHARNVVEASGEELEISAYDLQGLEPEEQLERILGTITNRNLMPRDIDPQMVRRYLEIRMARILAIRRYQPQTYAGPMTLFRAAEVNRDAPLAEAQKVFEKAALDPTYGWDKIVQRAVDVKTVPGNHESMIRAPHVRVLAGELADHLAEAWASWLSRL